MLFMYIIGICNLIMSGMYLSTILYDKKVLEKEPTLTQYGMTILGFVLGNYLLIACIGKATN